VDFEFGGFFSTVDIFFHGGFLNFHQKKWISHSPPKKWISQSPPKNPQPNMIVP